MKIYEDLWPKLCALQDVVMELRPAIDSQLGLGETNESRKKNRLEKVTIAYKNLAQTVRDSRPFYPPIIWDELGSLLKLCYKEAFQFGHTDEDTKWTDYWDDAIKNSGEIDRKVEAACEAIRARLTCFDDGEALLSVPPRTV